MGCMRTCQRSSAGAVRTWGGAAKSEVAESRILAAAGQNRGEAGGRKKAAIRKPARTAVNVKT